LEVDVRKDKLAAAAHFALTRAKRKLRDRENRLALVRYVLANSLVLGDRRAMEILARAANCRIRDWRLEV
jgi:hypothetical protein